MLSVEGVKDILISKGGVFRGKFKRNKLKKMFTAGQEQKRLGGGAENPSIIGKVHLC